MTAGGARAAIRTGRPALRSARGEGGAADAPVQEASGEAASWRGTLDDTERPRRLGYVPPLDGLRGVAVLTVVAFHAAFLTGPAIGNPLAGGFLGVDLFFAISGFLITAGLVDELQSRRSIGYGDFWQRRLRRLYPALVGLLAVVAAVLALTGWKLLWWGRSQPFVPLSDGQVVRAVLGTFAYVSNWLEAWHVAYPYALSHTWSLSVEMQFYLVWPLVILAALRWRWRRSTLVAIVVLASAGAALDRALSWRGAGSALGLYVRTDTRADTILLGCLGGLLVTWRWADGTRARAVLRPLSLLAAGGLVTMFIVARLEAEWMFRFGFLVVALAAAVLVTAVALEPGWLLGRILSTPILVWIGKRSYSIYLWHLPVFLAFAEHSTLPRWPLILGALAVTAAASEASYRLVENPLRATPRRVTASRLGAA